MKIHHIGYLVDDIENSAREFEKLGFIKIGKIVEDLSREIYILFLDNMGQTVELIQPVSEKSPVYGILKKYRNSPYHICYETDDLQGQIANMVKIGGGYALMQAPQPAPAIRGCPNVAFLMSANIGMIKTIPFCERHQ